MAYMAVWLLLRVTRAQHQQMHGTANAAGLFYAELVVCVTRADTDAMGGARRDFSMSGDPCSDDGDICLT